LNFIESDDPFTVNVSPDEAKQIAQNLYLNYSKNST